jgi:hypothetical protein
MTWLRLRFAASRRSRLRPISGSASLSLPSSGFPQSSLAADWCTTDLTSMRGWMTISAEGGPERRQKNNGP